MNGKVYCPRCKKVIKIYDNNLGEFICSCGASFSITN